MKVWQSYKEGTEQKKRTVPALPSFVTQGCGSDDGQTWGARM